MYKHHIHINKKLTNKHENQCVVHYEDLGDLKPTKQYM